MQMRFLELLEGLPEEVQNAILEGAYTQCVLKICLSAVLEGCTGHWRIEADYNIGNDGHLTGVVESKLEAWKAAYERLQW